LFFRRFGLVPKFSEAERFSSGWRSQILRNMEAMRGRGRKPEARSKYIGRCYVTH
jgi:hypothetical protein